MARRKSHASDKEDVKSRRGLPSYPYVVYASWVPPGHEMRWLILKFPDAWGARNMINSLTHNLFGGKYELKKTSSLGWHYMQFENGMRISLRDDERYQEVMELEFDETEAFVSAEVQQFKYGSGYESHRSNGKSSYDGDDQAQADEGTKRGGRGRKERSKSASDRDEPRALRERRPKVDRSGMVSANDIAKELGVEGREVRGVLRSLKMTKPEGGWLFNPKEADQLKADIKAHLKK